MDIDKLLYILCCCVSRNGYMQKVVALSLATIYEDMYMDNRVGRILSQNVE